MSNPNKYPAPSPERAAMHDTTNQKGAGVIVYCSATKRVLYGLRGTDCANPELWAPFGGMVEPGEDPRAAAARELEEEAGIVLSDNEMSNALLASVKTDERTGFQFFTFFATVDREPAVTINEESSGYAWFSLNSFPSDDKVHPGAELSTLMRHLMR